MTRAPITVEATDGLARAGRVALATGRSFTTPCFMPVGTRGAVRTIDAEDLERLGAQVVLGNTYHLMLKPGADVVAGLGGLHRFTGYEGPMLTDSGGFQVFSLKPKVDDDGVTFRSTYDGSSHRFTPERAVEVQRQLGADIQMVLDVCPPLPSPDSVVQQAVERTAAWAARAKAAHRDPATDDGTQSLFGIVQGGIDPAMRRASAARTVALDFDGYGIGGLSVGETRAEMGPALQAACEVLPTDRLRYLMGVGDPARLSDAVAAGVDVFDCVLPTRHARHHTALTSEGKVNLRNARLARDDGPLDPTCDCTVCQRWPRGYLRHLAVTNEPTGGRLITLHNLAFLFRFVDDMRRAIQAGTFAEHRAATLALWAPGEPDPYADAEPVR